jgi:dipeptidyl aminopeptidase/acylaminoacyl peptidase
VLAHRPALVRAFLFALTLTTAVGCENVPRSGQTIQSVPTYDAETFYETDAVFGASFSADGRQLLLTSDQSGVYNACSIPVGGGSLTQLTDSTTDAILTRGWFPEDDRFLFTKDEGGNELNHLYVRELDGSTVDLTPGENVKAGFVRWADDASRFFVTTNERDPQAFDLYEYSLRADVAADSRVAYPRRIIYENTGGFDVSDISRKGTIVALTKTRSNADNDIFVTLTDSPTAELIHVTEHEGNVSHSVADFSPDGRSVYFTSNEGSEFARVWSYDMKSGRRAVVFAAPWDVSSYRFSRDGRHAVVSVNADARTEVNIFSVETGKRLRLPQVTAGDVRGVSLQPGGVKLAYYVNGDSSPSNLHVVDLTTGDERRLTNTLSPNIDEHNLVQAEVIRYKSFDGLEIPALLYRPHQASARAPIPALVWVHGGPGGQSRHGYNPMIQHLVNNGYGVLAVNNRGSSGYGKTFFHRDDQKHGDVDLGDCIAGRKYLEGLGWVDGKRVGIIGGSYGGFMVCAALAFEPEAFEAGVDIFGVTNWIRTLESIPPWWADFRDSLYAEMGDPATDRERLVAISPLFHAENIRRPLLVVQGANDPRVLQAESDELVAAVRANGVPVEYVLFPDEGHGFRRRENRIVASTAFVTFLDRYLKGHDEASR